MIHVRRSEERGRTQWNWLESWHTFSFGAYQDPRFPEWRSLRFVNEDRIVPGMGFGMRPHHDLEILTLVLHGTMFYKDSLGNQAVLGPGDMQLVSTGSGLLHSEMNASVDEPLHLLQLGIEAEQDELDPGYQKATFSPQLCRACWCLLASRDETPGAFVIRQKLAVYRTMLQPDDVIVYRFDPGHSAWVHVVSGSVVLEGQALGAGDGAGIEAMSQTAFRCVDPADLLLLDFAG